MAVRTPATSILAGTYIVIRQWSYNPQPMLPSLEHSPVDSLVCLLVNHSKRWHETQRIPYADTQRLTPDQFRSHCGQRSHHLSRAALGWITSVKGSVERLSCRWYDILVESEPIHICTARCPLQEQRVSNFLMKYISGAN
jgi:hypothetical protein